MIKMSRGTYGYEGKRLEAYYYFNGFTNLSLGLHVNWMIPNIEVHLPFGFIRIGVRSHQLFCDKSPNGRVCRCTDYESHFRSAAE